MTNIKNLYAAKVSAYKALNACDARRNIVKAELGYIPDDFQKEATALYNSFLQAATASQAARQEANAAP